MFTHRFPRNPPSPTSSKHHRSQSDTSRQSYFSIPRSRPSVSDTSPSSTESYPLTPLSSTSTSKYSASHRKSSTTTPPSSVDSALPTASTYTSKSDTPSTPTYTTSPLAKSKPRFKMPFRDRVARKFGETVSSGSFSDSLQIQPHGYTTCGGFPAVRDDLTPFCASSTTLHDDHQVVNMLPSTIHILDPRLGLTSGRGLSCARPRIASCRDRAPAAIPYHEHKDEKFLRKALGSRQGRVIKPASKTKTMTTSRRSRPKAKGTTGSSTGVVQGPSTRSSSRTSRPSSSSSTTSTRSSTSSSVYNHGRRLGARVTRASARLADANGNQLTDKNGKQLSPTSPYLSCKYLAFETRPRPPYILK